MKRIIRIKHEVFGWERRPPEGERCRMAEEHLLEAALTRSVIGAFYEVYNTLGFGFLEHLYVMAMERELLARGHQVARQVGVEVVYKGEVLGTHRLDMLVDGKLVIETKSTYELQRAAHRQVFNYLKATGIEVGLLLHFGPEPKFYRFIRIGPRSDPSHPSNPGEPSEVKTSPSLTESPRTPPLGRTWDRSGPG